MRQAWLIASALCAMLAAPATASGRYHDHDGFRRQPQMEYRDTIITEERWWWRQELPRRWVPPQYEAYCDPRIGQGPPVYDRYGNVIGCAPRW